MSDTGPTSGRSRRIAGAETLKALAHPLRQRILEHLQVRGPATSTTLAGALGENTGTLSYHLRQLERGGLIEDVPDRASGRERWWRMVPDVDVRRPRRDSLPAAERAVLDSVEQSAFDDDMEIAAGYLRAHGEWGDWAQGSRSTRHMTVAELRAFHDAYLELLRRYGHGPEDAPPDSRAIRLRWFALPYDEPGD